MDDKNVTLVAQSFMGMGDPVFLVRPFVRKVVARTPLWQAKRLKEVRD